MSSLAHHLTFLLVEVALLASISVANFVDKEEAVSTHFAGGCLLGVLEEDSKNTAKQLEDFLTLESRNLTEVDFGDSHVGGRVGHGARVRRRSGGR